MEIRTETPCGVVAIRQVTEAAFEDAKYSAGTEALIVDKLRATGVLTVSLVAETAEQVVGHVAFSPITIDGKSVDCYGLGPSPSGLTGRAKASDRN